MRPVRQVSVIVPSYNSFSTVSYTLASLFEQQPASLLKEVLVVDSSDDGATGPFLETVKHEKLRVVRLPEKTMPALARNLGAQQASGEVLAFIDSDAYAELDWLEKIVSAYQRGCRVGGGAILLPPEQRARPLALAQYFLQFSEFMGHAHGRVRFVPSCNVFCEKKLFDEVGGFPEVRAAEDVLFGARVESLAAFHFDPAIRVRHIFSETWKRYRTNQTLLGEYALAHRRLNPKSWLHRGPAPLLLLPVFAPVKLFRIASRVCRSGDKELRRAFFRHLPLLLIGLFFLTCGFAKACFKWKY